MDTDQAATPTSQDIMLEGDLLAFLQANSLYECNTTEDLIKFYHGCLLFPVKSMWLKAIKAGYFKGWPGLTNKRVQKHIKVVDETEKGHMNRVQQGQRSSKTPPKGDHMDTPEQTPTNEKTHLIFMTMVEATGKIYSDQTGRFPITSARGHAYVVIFYNYDGNHIKSVPIKNRTKEELLRAYTNWHTSIIGHEASNLECTSWIMRQAS